jgi:UMF1 family MFS transporter
VGITFYAAVAALAPFVHHEWQFWMLGLMIGLVQGGTQAMSRSLFSSMVPEGMSAEFFGFFSIFNKVGNGAGPLVFGLVREFTASSRQAIPALVAFFVLGFLFLTLVNISRGREQARAFVIQNSQ